MPRMVVHSIPDTALGNTSYLIEAGDGVALSIDPRRDVAEHQHLAARRGLRIVAALETHLHADFVGGARELAAGGAQIVAAADAQVGFEHRAVRPGDRITFGPVSVRVVATPGHTPEHVAYLVADETGRALFSGGSLIAGGAARTDLSGPDQTDRLSRAQFAGLRALAQLPGDTMLYPTHGGGSFCSAGPARTTATTIEAERETNPLLAIDDEDQFVAALRGTFGSYPRYFNHLRRVNQAGAPLLGSLPAIPMMPAAGARDAVAGGAWLIDARSPADWARAHATGAVSIAYRDAFASWLGWVVPFGDPIVLMLEEHDLAGAVRLARRIGYDAIRGWLPFQEWQNAELPVASVPQVDPAEAATVTAEGAVMLDVRQAGEFASARIPGAVHMELGDIIAGKTPEADRVVTYCGHGERSATAASLLERRGIQVWDLRGGTIAWRAAGMRLET